MIRKIIEINEEKCNGCGLCAKACHENAIGMVNGKAKLLRDDYCDGLGDCLPTCPTGAITFVEREAAAYDEAAVEANKRKKNRQWPIQIQLTPVNAPYFDGADLLIAADCTAFAYANFAKEIQKGKITLIGCPKLDPVDYSEKLTEILEQNDVKSVTIIRMEVPCCGGIQNAAVTAMKKSGKFIPWQVLTVSVEGEVL
ncbi:MAG: ATP-binding protein [Hominisplanchenecus sp.]|uniref:ATP-binding protein n=1 Tax=Hominisplanchenecus sp. TaxID=3038130 RepID=UPI0039922386